MVGAGGPPDPTEFSGGQGGQMKKKLFDEALNEISCFKLKKLL